MSISRRDMLKATAAGLALPAILGTTGNVWGQPGSGNKGFSLHIGLNRVNPAGYGGWDGKLSGCINDARTYEAIATKKDFKHLNLHDERATVGNVASYILHASKHLKDGDLFLVTYAGHGGQMPDVSGDEADDRTDETWCLFDRQMADDELYRLWRYFEKGVRILVLSDSCHSGTVTRTRDLATEFANGNADKAIRFAFPDEADRVTREVKARAGGVQNANARSLGTRAGSDASASDLSMFRQLPPALVQSAYDEQKDVYDAIDRSIGSGDPGEKGGTRSDPNVRATVLLISGCKDDQLSMESNGNGLFTTVLNKVWNGGGFKGNYDDFHKAIQAKMPAKQQPNLLEFGTDTFQKRNVFEV